MHRRRGLRQPPRHPAARACRRATGETLADNADVDFTFGDKPPYVGFAGEGVILPREESDGVGIETVNVTKLAVEVWRVPDRNLVRKSISAPDATAEGEYADDYGDDQRRRRGPGGLEGRTCRSRAAAASAPPPSSPWARC